MALVYFWSSMAGKLFFSTFALSIVFFTSCKKDDTTAPQVSISSPAAQSTYNVFDTIWVSGTVSDNETISAVSIRLLNAAQMPVLPTVQVPFSGNQVYFERPVVLSNIHLETGVHFINLFASDGDNDANAFVEINVVEAPLEVLRYVVVSRQAGLVRLDTISPQFQLAMQTQWSGDHSTSAVNSYHQQVVVGGGNVSATFARHPEDGSVLWSLPNGNVGSLPYFKDVRFSEDHLLTYISDEEGRVRGYSPLGSISFTAQVPGGYRPQKVLGHGDKVLVELERIVPPERLLAYFWKTSGVLWQDFLLNKAVVGMFPRTEDRVLLFANDNGMSKVQEWSLDNGDWWPRADLSAGELFDVVALNSVDYALAHEDGIYRFNYNTNADVMLVGGVQAQHLAFDKLNGLLLAAVGTELRFYDANSGSLLNTVPLGDEAEAIGVLYNK